MHRHVDHVRNRRVNGEKEEISVSEKELPPKLPVELPPETQEPVQADPREVTQPEIESPHTPGRRSRRIRRAPEKLN